MSVLIGLMSGTSLDGVSAVAVRFVEHEDGRIDHTMLAFRHRPYAPSERQRLEGAMRGGTAQEYCRLHADLGDWLADAAVMALAESGVARADVGAVVSHGQTVWHEPGHSTWQLGDAARIAERTGCAVIADLRSRDVAAGGQGAPLVPMADALLFAHETGFRALQNLGGIGNVTVVPPAPVARAGDLRAVRAFDTGPGVVIIDAVTRALHPGLAFDRDGALASAGTPIQDVVTRLLAHPFFRADPPKSTGREWFSREYIDDFIGLCRAHAPGCRSEDVIATATRFTAQSIADQYARFVPEPIQDVILAGGGAKNTALVTAIESALALHDVGRDRTPVRVRRFDELYFDSEAKEAVAFALMGYLHLTGRSGNVPSATGARASRRLGHYTPAA